MPEEPETNWTSLYLGALVCTLGFAITLVSGLTILFSPLALLSVIGPPAEVETGSPLDVLEAVGLAVVGFGFGCFLFVRGCSMMEARKITKPTIQT
jgi:hypothetical protein